jgi:hypothetical protein
MQCYEAYEAGLSPASRAALRQVIAASWNPIELAHDHFGAIERLGLDTALVEANTGAVASKLHGALVATLARAARISGVTPLAALRMLAQFWHRLFDGGAIGLSQRGPKDIFVFIALLVPVPSHRDAQARREHRDAAQ